MRIAQQRRRTRKKAEGATRQRQISSAGSVEADGWKMPDTTRKQHFVLYCLCVYHRMLQVHTKQGRALVFTNAYQHHVKDFDLAGMYMYM